MGRDITRTQNKVILAAQAGSFADRTSEDINTGFACGLILVVVLANKAGTVGITPTIQGKLGNGTYYTFHTFTELTANGTKVYQISPFTTISADGLTESCIGLLPETIRVVLDVTTGAGDGNEFDTYAEIEMVQV
jgi:hypothetical protein